MSTHLVIGAGAVGTAITNDLVARGDHVTLVSRRGVGPHHPSVTRVAADAGDADRVGELARGASTIFNCANPAYHRWPTDWPPIAASLLRAAERSGAVLATTANLYVYGAPDGPMTPDTPMRATFPKARVRADMWNDALNAHDAGRVRATEVRASDYLGANAQSVIGQRAVPRLLAGRSCRVLGDPDATHSWTYPPDVARTLVACADQPLAWGHAWHAPTNPPRSQRELIGELCDAAGVARVKVTRIPDLAIRVAGLVNPTIRELPHTMYQFTAPFVIDDTRTRESLGLEPTPWDEVLRATLDGAAPPSPR